MVSRSYRTAVIPREKEPLDDDDITAERDTPVWPPEPDVGAFDVLSGDEDKLVRALLNEYNASMAEGRLAHDQEPRLVTSLLKDMGSLCESLGLARIRPPTEKAAKPAALSSSTTFPTDISASVVTDEEKQQTELGDTTDADRIECVTSILKCLVVGELCVGSGGLTQARATIKAAHSPVKSYARPTSVQDPAGHLRAFHWLQEWWKRRGVLGRPPRELMEKVLWTCVRPDGVVTPGGQLIGYLESAVKPANRRLKEVSDKLEMPCTSQLYLYSNLPRIDKAPRRVPRSRGRIVRYGLVPEPPLPSLASLPIRDSPLLLALVSAYTNGGKYVYAYKHLRAYEAIARSGKPGCNMTTYVLNRKIEICGRLSLMSGILNAWEEFYPPWSEDTGRFVARFDDISISVVLDALARCQDGARRAQRLWQALKDVEYPLSRRHYEAYLELLARTGRLDLAVQEVSLMIAEGFKPRTKTYYAVASFIVRSNRTDLHQVLVELIASASPEALPPEAIKKHGSMGLEAAMAQAGLKGVTYTRKGDKSLAEKRRLWSVRKRIQEEAREDLLAVDDSHGPSAVDGETDAASNSNSEDSDLAPWIVLPSTRAGSELRKRADSTRHRAP